MTRWSMAALGLVLIAAGSFTAGTAPTEDMCRVAGRRYAHLSQAESESCSELVTLAKACSCPDDDYLDYVPRSCGGHAQ